MCVVHYTVRPFPFRPTEFGWTQGMARVLSREQFDRTVGEGRHAFPACVRKLSCYAVGMQASIGFLSSSQEEKRGREAMRERERETWAGYRRGAVCLTTYGHVRWQQHKWPYMSLKLVEGADHDDCWCHNAVLWHLLPGLAIKQSELKYKSHLIPWTVIRIPDPNLCHSHSHVSGQLMNAAPPQLAEWCLHGSAKSSRLITPQRSNYRPSLAHSLTRRDRVGNVFILFVCVGDRTNVHFSCDNATRKNVWIWMNSC